MLVPSVLVPSVPVPPVFSVFSVLLARHFFPQTKKARVPFGARAGEPLICVRLSSDGYPSRTMRAKKVEPKAEEVMHEQRNTAGPAAVSSEAGLWAIMTGP